MRERKPREPESLHLGRMSPMRGDKAKLAWEILAVIALPSALSLGGYVNRTLSWIFFGISAACLIAWWFYRSRSASALVRKRPVASGAIAFLLLSILVGSVLFFRLHEPTQKEAEQKSAALQKVPNESAGPEYRDPFFVRAVHLVLFDHADPFFYYRYHSGIGELLAPVPVMLSLEVTNERGIASKVSRYRLEVDLANRWVVLPSLEAVNPMDFCYVKRPYNLKRAAVMDFSQNNFDREAMAKTLGPGETLSGWMFFELPREMRGPTRTIITGLRITIENSHGESQTTVLELPTGSPGESALNLPYLKGKWPIKRVNISSLRIVSRIDLHEAFANGSIR